MKPIDGPETVPQPPRERRSLFAELVIILVLVGAVCYISALAFAAPTAAVGILGAIAAVIAALGLLVERVLRRR